METIFIIGAAQAVFLSFLVVSKKHKAISDYVLALWLAFIGLHLFHYYCFSIGQLDDAPSLFASGVCFPLLQGPLMFVYVLTRIDIMNRFKREYWLHTIPFIFFNIYFLFDFHFLGYEEKLAYLEKAKFRELPMVALVNYLNVFLGPVYLLLSLLKLRGHNRNIDEVYSYHENIDLKWLKYVLVGMAIVWVTVVIAFSLSTVLPITRWEWLNHTIYLSVAFSVFFLGYFGLKQQVIYSIADGKKTIDKKPVQSDRNIKEIPPRQYEKSGLKPEDAVKHRERLNVYMENEKPYLNGKLSLKEVADALDLSPNHLSEVINGQLNQNFFDFVNSYRVRLVKEKMADPQYNNYSLLGVALECGFNSKSSFNAIFKKATGQTPTEYLRSL